MHSELERNIPGNSSWEGSFYERLTEYGEWNINAFWKLHYDLVNIAKNQDTDLLLDRNLAYRLLYLQQRVLTLISSHFSKDIEWEISNINSDEIYEFKERFEMAILGAVSGEVLPEDSFDLVNPLVKNA